MPPFDKRLLSVKGLLAEINTEVAQLPDASLRAMIPALVQAERELSSDLAGLVGGLGDGYNAQRLRRALVQVRGSMNAINSVRQEMLQELVKAGARAGQLSTTHLAKELAKFSIHFDATITPVPLVPASKLARGLLLDRFTASTNRWSHGARMHIRRELTVGMLRGETVGEMVARLTGTSKRKAMFLNAQGVTAQADALSAAMMKRVKYDATRIVRTEVINAYNEHAHDQIKRLHDEDDDRIQMRWCAEVDGRVCIVCYSLDGKVADVRGEFLGGFARCPAHPQCRCCITAWRADWPSAATARLDVIDKPPRPR